VFGHLRAFLILQFESHTEIFYPAERTDLQSGESGLPAFTMRLPRKENAGGESLKDGF
jgi:hypothetical protein